MSRGRVPNSGDPRPWCEPCGKYLYGGKASRRLARKLMVNDRNGGRIEHYHCPAGGAGWHVGHRSDQEVPKHALDSLPDRRGRKRAGRAPAPRRQRRVRDRRTPRQGDPEDWDLVRLP